MEFDIVRTIILGQNNKRKCLPYTEAYDTHNWEFDETKTYQEGTVKEYKINVYRCSKCGYYLDIYMGNNAGGAPGVEDFTGHMGDCSDEIIRCDNVKHPKI